MKAKNLLSILALAAAFAAHGALDVITVPTGETVTCPWAAKVVSARVLSTVAAGTATAKSVTSIEIMAPVTNVVNLGTNYTYTVISTQYVGSAWATVTNTVPVDPSPWGTENWTGFTTNSVVLYATNVTWEASSRVVSTNALTAAITCSGGVGAGDGGTKPYIAPGEPIFIEGTAKGRVQLFVER